MVTTGFELPPRQYDCLQAIAKHWRAYGEGPTRSELGRALGITKVSAHLLVEKLHAAGLVIRQRGAHRGVMPA
jgi:DNA-binding MarR family transcriptional regulator